MKIPQKCHFSISCYGGFRELPNAFKMKVYKGVVMKTISSNDKCFKLLQFCLFY